MIANGRKRRQAERWISDFRSQISGFALACEPSQLSNAFRIQNLKSKGDSVWVKHLQL